MKEKIFNVIFGLNLLALGIVLFGDVINIWNLGNFFKGWWSIFIMVPSLFGIFLKSTTLSYTFILGIGVVCLLYCQRVLGLGNSFLVLGALFVFLLGIEILYLTLFKHRKKKMVRNMPLFYTAIFGGVDEKFAAKLFNGCKIMGVFGSVELDLSETKIAEDIEIEVSCVFGGVNIVMPKDVDVVIVAKSILGGIENSKVRSDKARKTVYIKGICVFGGIEVK